MKTIDDLIDILTLKKQDSKTYTGTSKTIGNSRVFGGQVLAQAFTRSIPNHPNDRFVHSLHSYFLLPGDLTIPITYKVTEMREWW